MGSMRRLWFVMLGEMATTPVFYTVHRIIYQLSRGKIFSRSVGCPVILLTTTGRKSGEPRTAPIFGFQVEQSIVAIPSNAGKKHYPAWYFNLRANPQAQVQVGRETRQMKAREASEEERERLWPRLASQYGGYDVYRARTDRYLPVVIFDPV